MLMVILGAGASYDFESSHTTLTWRAPLTDSLVDPTSAARALLNDIPDHAAGGLVGHLRAQRTKTNPVGLEADLDAVQAGGGADRELLAFRMYVHSYMQTVSAQGLEDVNWVTNQALLVRTIENWRRQEPDRTVAYVTFNYDTILDQALAAQYGWRPVDDLNTLRLNQYISGDPRFLLLKMHGSSDWAEMTDRSIDPFVARSSDRAEVAKKILLAAAAAGPLNIAEPVGLASTRPWSFDWIRTRTGNQTYCNVPAMALPLGSKVTFGCPQEHLAKFDSVWPNVDRLLTIGWKGGEPHFLDRLKLSPHSVRLEVVSKSEVTKRDVKERLEASGMAVNGSYTPGPGGEWAFSSFLQDGGLEAFLSRP